MSVGAQTTVPLELDRPRTLAGPRVHVLDSLRAAQALGSADLRFGIARAVCDTFCHRGWNLGTAESPLRLSPLGGVEGRTVGDTDQVGSWEGGVRVSGSKGPLWFTTDARIFMERHGDNHAASWDGEVVDRSQEGELSHATFTSFARYRATVELATPVGAFGFRREPLHWGPGRHANLVFQKDAVPFPHLYWQGDFGDASVEAIWGRLTIDGIGDYRRTHDTRSVYAHRYEWRPVQNLSLGVSEMLILYNQETFAGLVPFVPLFIEKGKGAERENNGNLAFDAAFRGGGCLFYGEFLIDDMQEPTSLFSDRYWGNRWAALGGAFWARPLAEGRLATIGLEWARVEPWVYTHFSANTAQPLNMGFPVGNQDGPNSQSIRADASFRGVGWGLTAGLKALWKGTDPGSQPTDTTASKGITGKVFLAGVEDPEWIPSAEIWKTFGRVSLHGTCSWSHGAATARARLLAWY